jgi:hypothetical protein
MTARTRESLISIRVSSMPHGEADHASLSHVRQEQDTPVPDTKPIVIFSSSEFFDLAVSRDDREPIQSLNDSAAHLRSQTG